MIFNIKRRQQRKNSWVVLRAITRIHEHDARANDIHHSSKSLSIQKEQYL